MELQNWKVFKNIDYHFAADVKSAYLVGIISSQDQGQGYYIEHEGGCEALPWSGGVMLMKNGDVYYTTLTTNICRQITKKKDEDLFPNVPVKIDALCGKDIRADVKSAYLVGIISSQDQGQGYYIEHEGGCEALPWSGGVMLMKNGDVYYTTLTTNICRQITKKKDEDLFPNVPVKIDALCGKDIRDVQSGVLYVVVLTTDGRAFQWGNICAEEEKDTAAYQLSFLSGTAMENERITQIACGDFHAMALTSEGQVYSWGGNDQGQLGIGPEEGDSGPTIVSGIHRPVSQIACGGHTSFALDTEGSVWLWCAVSHEDDRKRFHTDYCQLIPLKMTHLHDIDMIAAGDHHLLALSKEMKLYFWGQHASEEIVATPRRMEVSNFESIGATRGCTISAFKTTEGKVYYWGFALGHNILEPVATKYSTMIELFASLDSPVMLGPLKFDLNQPMTEKLKLAFDDSDTADIAFIAEERRIHAHKLTLKLRSEYFNRMFDNNWKESEHKEVKITDFTHKGFRTFLFYLYTDRIEPTPEVVEDAFELFRLADYYGEDDLKRRCEQQIRFLITADNFSQIYSASVLLDYKTLHGIALDLAISSLIDILDTDGYKSMPEELQKRLMQELPDEDGLVQWERKRLKFCV